jgi:hypothetical protein
LVCAVVVGCRQWVPPAKFEEPAADAPHASASGPQNLIEEVWAIKTANSASTPDEAWNRMSVVHQDQVTWSEHLSIVRARHSKRTRISL